MQLDKASCYALFATVCIAQQAPDRPVQGRTVATLCDLPFEYLLKILQQLARNGVLISERGRTGGFRLARSPDETTLLEIIEAIQGPIRPRVFGVRKARLSSPEQLIDRLCTDLADHARTKLSRMSVTDLIASE
jgi:Rrf2 family protein